MGWLPSLRGVIDRRILVNFRLDPDALDPILPAPFEPRTVDGVAIGGVCCLRLTDVRPRGVPSAFGLTSENAAHRIGVTWEERGAQVDGGERVDGVYVPRRDTDSRLNRLLGDRTFGRHEYADFAVEEREGRYELTMTSHADDTRLHVVASETDSIPDDSVFDDLSAAVAYHQCGTVGYSPAPDGSRYDGVALAVDDWDATPLSIESVSATLFDRLPEDSVTVDNALLMTDVGNELRRQTPIEACPSDAPAALSD